MLNSSAPRDWEGADPPKSCAETPLRSRPKPNQVIRSESCFFALDFTFRTRGTRYRYAVAPCTRLVDAHSPPGRSSRPVATSNQLSTTKRPSRARSTSQPPQVFADLNGMERTEPCLRQPNRSTPRAFDPALCSSLGVRMSYMLFAGPRPASAPLIPAIQPNSHHRQPPELTPIIHVYLLSFGVKCRDGSLSTEFDVRMRGGRISIVDREDRIELVGSAFASQRGGPHRGALRRAPRDLPERKPPHP